MRLGYMVESGFGDFWRFFVSRSGLNVCSHQWLLLANGNNVSTIHFRPCVPGVVTASDCQIKSVAYFVAQEAIHIHFVEPNHEKNTY